MVWIGSIYRMVEFASLVSCHARLCKRENYPAIRASEFLTATVDLT